MGGFIGMMAAPPPPRRCCSTTGTILCKAHQLSNGNPIQDTIEMFENLRGQVEAQSAKLEVLGVAAAGYAKDILKDVLHADVALVETVAHTESALKSTENHSDRRCGWAGHQDHHPAQRAGQRFQVEHAVFRG